MAGGPGGSMRGMGPLRAAGSPGGLRNGGAPVCDKTQHQQTSHHNPLDTTTDTSHDSSDGQTRHMTAALQHLLYDNDDE